MKPISAFFITLTLFVLSGCGQSLPSSVQDMPVPNIPKEEVSLPLGEVTVDPTPPCPIAVIPDGWYCYTLPEYAVLMPSDFSGIGMGDAGNFISKDGKHFINSNYFKSDVNPLIQEGKYKEFVETGFDSLCAQTESCPKIISAEYVTLEGKKFLKYEEELLNGSIDKPGAPYSVFHYATVVGNYWVDFSTPDKQNLPVYPYENGVWVVTERVDEALFEKIVTTSHS